MDKVKISEIEKTNEKLLHIDFDEEISEVNAQVKASIDVVSLGDFVNVKGKVFAKVNLVCDLCLKNYTQDFEFNIDETFAKNSIYDDEKQEVEIKDGQFVIDLYGSDEIDIYDLLYQSVILELPNKKVCGINCKEDSFTKEDSFKVHDDRMDIFKTIKIE